MPKKKGRKRKLSSEELEEITKILEEDPYYPKSLLAFSYNITEQTLFNNLPQKYKQIFQVQPLKPKKDPLLYTESNESEGTE